MEYQKLLNLFSLLTFLTVKCAGGKGTTESSNEEGASNSDGDSVDWHQSICSDFKGGYARKSNLGLVCCANQTLLQPVEVVESWETNPLLDDCTLEVKTSQDSDMPTAFWNVWICVLKKASAFPEGKMTFENFFTFITGSYSPDMKSKISAATASCKKDGDKLSDPVTKLQKFTECFHKSEHEVCHKPYAKSIYSEVSKTTSPKECPGMEGIYGSERLDYCCQKKSVPFNFLDFYVHFPLTDLEREKTDNCSESFTMRQMALDPKLKAALAMDETGTDAAEEAYNNASAAIDHCTVGCEILQKNYGDVKDLEIDFEKAVAYMVRYFNKNIRTQLEKIILSRKSKFQYHSQHTGEKILSLEQLKKGFEGADEMFKLRYYCGFAASLIIEVERALHEYCLDKEYADKWFAVNHT